MDEINNSDQDSNINSEGISGRKPGKISFILFIVLSFVLTFLSIFIVPYLFDFLTEILNGGMFFSDPVIIFLFISLLIGIYAIFVGFTPFVIFKNYKFKTSLYLGLILIVCLVGYIIFQYGFSWEYIVAGFISFGFYLLGASFAGFGLKKKGKVFKIIGTIIILVLAIVSVIYYLFFYKDWSYTNSTDDLNIELVLDSEGNEFVVGDKVRFSLIITNNGDKVFCGGAALVSLNTSMRGEGEYIGISNSILAAKTGGGCPVEVSLGQYQVWPVSLEILEPDDYEEGSLIHTTLPIFVGENSVYGVVDEVESNEVIFNVGEKIAR